MNIHVECNGCAKEEAPLCDSGPLVGAASARYHPPAGWRELENYLFCAACWPHVQVAIERAVAALLREGP